MDDEHWVPTGTRSRVRSDTNRVPVFAGEHLWTWTAIFRASPCEEQPALDGRSLLRITGITCYYCRRQYSKRAPITSLCGGPIG